MKTRFDHFLIYKKKYVRVQAAVVFLSLPALCTACDLVIDVIGRERLEQTLGSPMVDFGIASVVSCMVSTVSGMMILYGFSRLRSFFFYYPLVLLIISSICLALVESHWIYMIFLLSVFLVMPITRTKLYNESVDWFRDKAEINRACLRLEGRYKERPWIYRFIDIEPLHYKL